MASESRIVITDYRDGRCQGDAGGQTMFLIDDRTRWTGRSILRVGADFWLCYNEHSSIRL